MPSFSELRKEAYYEESSGMLFYGDCLEWMSKFPDKSIDMILCDLPYGTTACKWDIIIPFESLWKQYKRIIRDDGNIVLTASQPFTSVLVTSNIKLFKYIWTWKKNRPTGFANAKKRPLKEVEDICVFGGTKSMYFPQGLIEINKTVKNSKSTGGDTTGKFNYGKEYIQTHTNYPRDVLEFGLDEKTKLHPTQKPVALFEYLIKTYTNENMIILDNTAGVCTTAIAAKNTNRRWICIEKEQKYCDVSVERIKSHD